MLILASRSGSSSSAGGWCGCRIDVHAPPACGARLGPRNRVYGVPGEDVAALKELLGLPEDIAFVRVVTIGRQPPKADDVGLVSRLTQARKPLDELGRWERWTAP